MVGDSISPRAPSTGHLVMAHSGTCTARSPLESSHGPKKTEEKEQAGLPDPVLTPPCFRCRTVCFAWNCGNWWGVEVESWTEQKERGEDQKGRENCDWKNTRLGCDQTFGPPLGCRGEMDDFNLYEWLGLLAFWYSSRVWLESNSRNIREGRSSKGKRTVTWGSLADNSRRSWSLCVLPLGF